MIRNTAAGYGLVAIVLHWTIAALVVGQIGLGLTMTRIESQRLAFELIQFHKSIGFLLLVLMMARLAWRLANPSPRAVLGMPRIETVAAGAVHRALYALFLALPLSGWALVSASVLAIPTLAFGLVLVPHLPIGMSEGGEAFWQRVHHLLAYAAIVLVLGHALAAFRHGLHRDGVMRRMLVPVTSRTKRESVSGPGEPTAE